MIHFNKIKAIAYAAGLILSGAVFAENPSQQGFNKGIPDEHYLENANAPGAVLFNPPEGWHIADPLALPPSVKLMVVGRGASEFPPSINLGTEKYDGTLSEYLKMIKAINESQGSEWKDLGTIRTQAGNASLSQVDAATEWGEVRMMHVILLKDGTAYILTAAALKEEFPKFYKEFFKSMRSVRFNKNLFEMVSETARRKSLIRFNEKLQEAWEKLYEQERKESPALSLKTAKEKIFESKEFQQNYWAPFKEMLSENYQDLGTSWKNHLLDQVHEELMNNTKVKNNK